MALLSDPGLRRVCIHAGTEAVDLTLPSAVPIAALIPSIVGFLSDDPANEAAGYQLSLPGSTAMPDSATLAEIGVRDGALLLLTRSTTPLPGPRYDDVAAGVSASLAERPDNRSAIRKVGALTALSIAALGGALSARNGFDANDSRAAVWVAAGSSGVALIAAAIAQRLRGDRLAGLTLSLVATTFAATAGLLAAPGVLLAAMGAAVTSVASTRALGRDSAALAAISCLSVVASLAALAGELAPAPWRVVGPIAALVSLVLLGVAARAAIVLAGLTPTPDVPYLPDEMATRAIRADTWMTGLVGGFSAAASGGAIIAARTAGLGGATFAAAAGALLLLRARHGARTGAVYLATGIATLATTLVVQVAAEVRQGPWLVAATTLLVAIAAYLGFVAPAVSLSQVSRRGLDLMECMILIAMAPLTCWPCGVFGPTGTLHGLGLT